MGKWIPLAALVLLALPQVAPAAESTVHVFTVGVGALPPPDDEEASRRAAELLPDQDVVVDGPLLQALDLLDPLFVPQARLAGCDGRPVRSDPITDGLAAARRAVDELEYGTARMLLEGGVELLPCLSDLVDPEVLYDLHFLSGLVAWYEQEPIEAEAAFARAVGVDPARPWNEAYAPDAKGLFLQALQRSIGDPGPVLRVSPDLRGRVLLDGRVVADGATVPRGGHLLQLSRGPVVLSKAVELPPARGHTEIRLLGPAALQEAVLAGDPVVADLLGHAAEARGLERLLVLGPDGAIEVHVVGRVFRETEGAAVLLTRSVERPKPDPRLVGGALLLGAGALAGGVGLAVHGRAWQQGRPWLEDPSYGPPGSYEALRRQNVAGFVVGVAGGAVLATGLVVTLSAVAGGPDARSAVAPFGLAGPDGAVLGLAESF